MPGSGQRQMNGGRAGARVGLLCRNTMGWLQESNFPGAGSSNNNLKIDVV